MALKAIYEKEDDVPEAVREHYAEKGGKWELQAEGMKTQADVDRVKSALDKEKKEHKDTKDKFKAFDGMDPEDVQSKLDEYDELKARVEAGGGEIPEDKIQAIVDKRVQREIAPIKRENDKLKTENDELRASNGELDGRIKMGRIETAVRKAAETAKVVPTAIDDIVALADRTFEIDDDGNVVTREGIGAAPGVGVDVYLTDMKEKRPHWWPVSAGGGSRGSNGEGGGADNPWSARGWNLTKQGQVLKENRSKAEQLASVAGVPVTGGRRPEEKK
jgi:hypothetical protein